MGNEAKEAEAVIDGDDDDFPAGCELGAIIAVAGAVNVAAAMNPEDDRQFLMFCSIDIRGIDVEIEAVFVIVGRSGK